MKRYAARLLFCVRLIAGSLLVAVMVTDTGVASAANAVDDASRGTARKLGYQGVAAYQAGDYRTASEKLEKAYGVLRVPSLGLWSARALVKLGKWVEGSERYAQVAQLGASTGNEAVQKKALADAESELSLLTPKIPSVLVRIEGASPADVRVQIDGAPIAQELLGEARPVNPGPHKIEGQRGTEQAVVELVLAEAEQKPALLRFQSLVAATPAASSATASPAVPASDSGSAGLGQQRTWALIAGGVGVVGVGVGTVFGFKSKADHDEAAKYCAGSECTNDHGASAGNDAHAAGNVSTVAMIVGGVGLASAAVLWFTAPHSSPQASARLGVGVGSLQIKGQF
ncbi:MAG TPA: hypothetical protein VGC79_09805 [Polyangiaceae bacterium]